MMIAQKIIFLVASSSHVKLLKGQGNLNMDERKERSTICINKVTPPNPQISKWPVASKIYKTKIM